MNLERLYALALALRAREGLSTGDRMLLDLAVRTIEGARFENVGSYPERVDPLSELAEAVRDVRDVRDRATGRADWLHARWNRVRCWRMIHGRDVSTTRAIRETSRVGAQ